MRVWGLLTSTRLLRGEEDGGRWDLLLAGQTTRRGATAQAIAGLGAGAVALWVVTAIITVLSGQSSSVRISVGPSLYFALAMVTTAVMFLAVGAVASQLVATRRQAASCGAALLGVSYAVRLIADAGVGLHGLIWASPLGWVEELQPLTSPRPLALLPIVAFSAVLAVAAVHLAGNRDVGASIVPDRAHSEAHLGLLFGPTGLAIRLMRAHGHRLVGGDCRVGAPLRSHRKIGRCHDLGVASKRSSPSSERPGRVPTRCSACAS